MRLARGIQNKVLEGMAMRRPIVTTAQGYEGIAAEPGRHLLVADTPHDFAAAIETALSPTGREMGENAYRLIRARYTWPAALARLDELIG